MCFSTDCASCSMEPSSNYLIVEGTNTWRNRSAAMLASNQEWKPKASSVTKGFRNEKIRACPEVAPKKAEGRHTVVRSACDMPCVNASSAVKLMDVLVSDGRWNRWPRCPTRFIAGIPASNACCTAPTWFETFISPASSCTNARCASFSNTLSNMALLLPDPEEVLITTGSIPVPGPSKFCPLKLAKPPRWAPMLMKGTSFNDRFWEEASWRKKGMVPFEMPGSCCSWPEVKAKIGANSRQLPLQGGSINHSLAIANNRAMPAPRSPAAWKKPLIGVPTYNGMVPVQKSGTQSFEEKVVPRHSVILGLDVDQRVSRMSSDGRCAIKIEPPSPQSPLGQAMGQPADGPNSPAVAQWYFQSGHWSWSRHHMARFHLGAKSCHRCPPLWICRWPPQSWQQGCAPLARHAKVQDAAGADEPHSMELQCYQQANGIHSLMMLPHPLASTPLVLARYRTDTEPQVLLPSAHQRSTGWWLHLCDFLSSEMGQEQRIPQQIEPRTPLRCVQRWPSLLLRPAEGHTQRACSF